MKIDFIDELPTVFNILKFNPGAIVDDTAIERLLGWLEDICSKRKIKLIDQSLDFFKSEEVWMHSMTLSFALRFAGYLGCHYVSISKPTVTMVKHILEKVTKHKQFSEATVQYAFYKCLNSLTKDLFWMGFLKDFLPTCLDTFTNSYLYVKKAAVSFLASLMHMTLDQGGNGLYELNEIIVSTLEYEQLYQISESVLLLSEHSMDKFLQYLHDSQIVSSLISNVKLCKDVNVSIRLLKSLECIFSILTTVLMFSSNIDWYGILSEKNPENFLIDFIKDLKSNGEFRMVIPSFCKSLMLSKVPGDKPNCFSKHWNNNLLQMILTDTLYDVEMRGAFDSVDHEIIADVKLWKRLLTMTLGEMVMVEQRINSDPLCQRLLHSWRSFCVKILMVSLSNDSERETLDEYLISVMYDKKVPRLCFQYLKKLDFGSFDEKLNEDFLDCLWRCLFCHTDCPQVVCGALDLVSRYISINDENLLNFMNYHQSTEKKPIMNSAYKFSDLLNKLLWDTNWEIQDSLIDLLLRILENANKGSDLCLNFLKENTFWVKVIDLINSQESYVRSKTVMFIGAVVLYTPLLEVFSVKSNYHLPELCKLLEDIFTSEERQDDMFTRRSILKILDGWVRSPLIHLQILKSTTSSTTTTTTRTTSTATCTSMSMSTSTSTSDDNENFSGDDNHSSDKSPIKTCLTKIMENSANDFDWEVRKLTYTVCRSLATDSNTHCPTCEYKGLFLDYMVESNFALLLIRGVCDCEYLVKMEAFKCLQFIATNILSTAELESEQSDRDESIESITEYEGIVMSYQHLDKNEFVKFMKRVDLARIGEQLDVLDVMVTSDPVSFIQDVIASSKQSEANLLDCY